MTVTGLAALEDRTWAEHDAAEFNGVAVRWWTPLDNYEVPRKYADGYGVRHTRRHGAQAFKFWPGEDVRDARQSVYVLDDGETAVPYYVAGWQQNGSGVFLESMAPREDDQTRSVNGHSGWALGPRRVYHLKISAVD